MPLKRTGYSGDKSEHGSPRLPKEKLRWRSGGKDFTESAMADSVPEIKVKEEILEKFSPLRFGSHSELNLGNFSHHLSSGDEATRRGVRSVDDGAQLRSLHLPAVGHQQIFFFTTRNHDVLFCEI